MYRVLVLDNYGRSTILKESESAEEARKYAISLADSSLRGSLVLVRYYTEDSARYVNRDGSRGKNPITY